MLLPSARHFAVKKPITFLACSDCGPLHVPGIDSHPKKLVVVVGWFHFKNCMAASSEVTKDGRNQSKVS